MIGAEAFQVGEHEVPAHEPVRVLVGGCEREHDVGALAAVAQEASPMREPQRVGRSVEQLAVDAVQEGLVELTRRCTVRGGRVVAGPGSAEAPERPAELLLHCAQHRSSIPVPLRKPELAHRHSAPGPGGGSVSPRVT